MGMYSYFLFVSDPSITVDGIKFQNSSRLMQFDWTSHENPEELYQNDHIPIETIGKCKNDTKLLSYFDVSEFWLDIAKYIT
jgi:hypothetical protein